MVHTSCRPESQLHWNILVVNSQISDSVSVPMTYTVAKAAVFFIHFNTILIATRQILNVMSSNTQGWARLLMNLCVRQATQTSANLLFHPNSTWLGHAHYALRQTRSGLIRNALSIASGDEDSIRLILWTIFMGLSLLKASEKRLVRDADGEGMSIPINNELVGCQKANSHAVPWDLAMTKKT